MGTWENDKTWQTLHPGSRPCDPKREDCECGDGFAVPEPGQSNISSKMSSATSQTSDINRCDRLRDFLIFRRDFGVFCQPKTRFLVGRTNARSPRASLFSIFNSLKGAPHVEQANSWRSRPRKVKAARVPQ